MTLCDVSLWSAIITLVSPTDPQEAQRTEMLKLKRRFVRDRNITSAFFAKTEAKKKIMREVSVPRTGSR